MVDAMVGGASDWCGDGTRIRGGIPGLFLTAHERDDNSYWGDAGSVLRTMAF
jgi:hypothetical protein